jgi:hypothetical protein
LGLGRVTAVTPPFMKSAGKHIVSHCTPVRFESKLKGNQGLSRLVSPQPLFLIEFLGLRGSSPARGLWKIVGDVEITGAELK